jgi:hypothetical protein
MNSKSNLYKDLKQCLQEIPEVGTVSLWNSQLDNIDSENAINFPCVYIEFNKISWYPVKQNDPINRVKNHQNAECSIVLHIGFDTVENEDDSFDYVNWVIEKIHQATQGLRGDYFSPLDRTFETQDINHDGLIVWEVQYDTLLQDGAVNQQGTISYNNTPVINKENGL